MRRRSWGWRLAAAAAAGVMALGLAACGDDDDAADTAASGEADITLRLGYVTAPEHPYGIAIDNFIEEVTTASDGAIAIEALPNYQGGDVPLLQDVRGGAVDNLLHFGGIELVIRNDVQRQGCLALQGDLAETSGHDRLPFAGGSR